MSIDGIVLAATVHDVEGKLAPALARSGSVLRDLFSGFAIAITDVTHKDVTSRLKSELGATLLFDAPNEAMIGKARRDAVALALEQDARWILYSDFDHAIRWAETDAREMRTTLRASPDAGLLVIGRSERAFDSEPERLKQTERLVNHTYALLTGRQWDLLFAFRRFSRDAAAEIVRASKVDTLANDVEWPLLAERAGYALAYAEADGLYYRTMEDFDAPADTHDGEPLEWIRRIEFAALQASAMRPFLPRK